MSKSQEEKDLDEQYEKDRPWIELWDAVLRFGLALFEPDGRGGDDKHIAGSIGLEHLKGLLTYFERIESYRRAGRVQKFIQEYKKRWPDATARSLDKI